MPPPDLGAALVPDVWDTCDVWDTWDTCDANDECEAARTTLELPSDVDSPESARTNDARGTGPVGAL